MVMMKKYVNDLFVCIFPFPFSLGEKQNHNCVFIMMKLKKKNLKNIQVSIN